MGVVEGVLASDEIINEMASDAPTISGPKFPLINPRPKGNSL